MNDRRHDDEHLERLADDLIGDGGSDSAGLGLPEVDVKKLHQTILAKNSTQKNPSLAGPMIFAH